MKTKICNKCNQELPIEDFHYVSRSKNTRRADCKVCRTTQVKNDYKNKQLIIEEQKSQLSCAKCGDTRGYVLDFHHLDGDTKDKTISTMLSSGYNLESINNEIQKCIVLCANCHREEHYLQNHKINE